MVSKSPSKYVAQEGVAASPDVQVIGSVLQAFAQNIRVEETRPLLQKYGFTTIESDQWYPQQLVLDFEMAVANSPFNGGENLVAIGMKIVDTMPFPESTKTIEDGVNAFNLMMRQIFRNTPEDETFFIPTSRPGYLLVIANLPYPYHALYGYLWGLAKRFRPSETEFKVVSVQNPKPEEYPGQAFEITWGHK
jgi:hypothetical protein